MELSERRRRRPAWSEGDWLKLRDGDWWAIPDVAADLEDRPALLRYVRGLAEGTWLSTEDEDQLDGWSRTDRCVQAAYDALAECLVSNYRLQTREELRALIGSRVQWAGTINAAGVPEIIPDYDWPLILDAGICLSNLITPDDRAVRVVFGRRGW